MSIYNGFGTRQQEASYNKALYNTIFLLQLRISKLFKGENFDDIKFGKVLTKLYARLFTMEKVKYLPPKYSYALKDLADFLGIFEITEDQIKKRGGDISETSSNISYVTQSGFKPKIRQLDVIREHTTYREEDDENCESPMMNKEGEEIGRAIGKQALTGSNRLTRDRGNNQEQAAFKINPMYAAAPINSQLKTNPSSNQSDIFVEQDSLNSSKNNKNNRNKSQRALPAAVSDGAYIPQQKQQQQRAGGKSVPSHTNVPHHESQPVQLPPQLKQAPNFNANEVGKLKQNGRTTINNNIIININNGGQPHLQNNQQQKSKDVIRRRPSYSSEKGEMKIDQQSIQQQATNDRMRKTDSEFNPSMNNSNIQENMQIRDLNSKNRQQPKIGSIMQSVAQRTISTNRSVPRRQINAQDNRRRGQIPPPLQYQNQMRLGSQGPLDHSDNIILGDVSQDEDGYMQTNLSPINRALTRKENHSAIGSPSKYDDASSNISFERKVPNLNNSMAGIYQQRQAQRKPKNQKTKSDSFNYGSNGSAYQKADASMSYGQPQAQYSAYTQKFVGGNRGHKFIR